MTLVRAPFFLALSALAAAASAQTVTLRYMPPVGKAYRYAVTNKMTMSMPGMGGQSSTQSIPTTMTALSRKGNETTVQSKTGQMTMDVPAGSPMAMSKDMILKAGSNKTTTVVVDAFGKPKGVAMGMNAASQMGGVQGVAFPVKPVKVGETWTVNLDMSKMGAAGGGAPGMKMTGNIPMRYTLKGIRKVGGKTMATVGIVIDGAAKMNAMGQPMTLTMKGSGVMTLEAATGVVSDSKLTMDTSTSFGARSFGQRMDVTMKLK